MPAEFWYPISATRHDIPAGYSDGTGDNSGARPGGGRAGPMTHDDAATYIAVNTNEAYAERAVNLDWPGPIGSYANAAGTITAGGRHAWISGAGPASIRSCFFLNATPTEGSAFVGVSDTNAAWVTTGPIDVSAAAYRPAGGTWVTSDFANDTTIFASMREGNAPTGFVQGAFTSIWGVLTYNAPSGGFVFLLGLAGALALPHVGRFPDFISFRRYLDWRTLYHPRHTKWSPGEDLVAWRDVQAYRYPTHFLPA